MREQVLNRAQPSYTRVLKLVGAKIERYSDKRRRARRRKLADSAGKRVFLSFPPGLSRTVSAELSLSLATR